MIQEANVPTPATAPAQAANPGRRTPGFFVGAFCFGIFNQTGAQPTYIEPEYTPQVLQPQGQDDNTTAPLVFAQSCRLRVWDLRAPGHTAAMARARVGVGTACAVSLEARVMIHQYISS